jgi:1-deoxy-D-xylulose 5-phosphate reductoisomerase
MKNILLLGATGSIGDSVLSVIEQNNEKLNLFGIALDNNIIQVIFILNQNHLLKTSKLLFLIKM